MVAPFRIIMREEKKNNKIRETYVSAKLLKILLAATPLLVFIKLFVRELNDIEIGDVVNDIGPPTSIGGESAFGGLPPEFCDVLQTKSE